MDICFFSLPPEKKTTGLLSWKSLQETLEVRRNISGVSQNLFHEQGNPLNSLLILDSKTLAFKPMNRGWEFARFLSLENKPQRKYLLIQRVEGAPKEITQPCCLTLMVWSCPFMLGVWEALWAHPKRWNDHSNLKGSTFWQWSKASLCIFKKNNITLYKNTNKMKYFITRNISH